TGTATATATATERIARYQLSNGARQTPLALPPGETSIHSLAVTGNGDHLIASLAKPNPACSPTRNCERVIGNGVWIEQQGIWTRVSDIQAVSVAW
ncbi:MAG: hypothetical protein M3256_00920, partial [Actinomycetota bacterium]|nr:hypothetical protein [Actinomycetota bacterium]